MKGQSGRPLCVDLDGTLIATDTLWESLILLLKRDPLAFLESLGALRHGKAPFKRFVSRHVQLDAATLPYRTEVVDYLRGEKERGRTLILSTACDEPTARAIAAQVGLFDDVVASDGRINLSGVGKRAELERRFGSRGYDYIGDSLIDGPVWDAAEEVHVVAGPGRARARARATGRIGHEFRPARFGLRTALRAIRVHQWSKNLLIFVPLITSHQFAPGSLARALAAFFAFSLTASAIYVLNDLLDLEADRAHPRKRNRPFAAGQLSIPSGLALIPALVLGGAAIALLALPPGFLAVLAVYLVLTTSYSFFLKSRFIVDVLLLAGLYTLRVLAGGVAIDVVVSEWLLAFSMFLFLSLAVMKRFGEVRMLAERGDERAQGRAYEPGDLQWLGTLGSASGYISVLVLALYANSEQVRLLYERPQIIWFVALVMLYWITRMWALAYRGRIDDDPLFEAIRDSRSWALAALIGVLLLVSAAW